MFAESAATKRIIQKAVCTAGMKRNRMFRGFPVLFRMRWGRAGRGRPGRRPPSWSGGRKRSDNHVLVRMKTEAVLHASRGVDVGVIAGMVERTERTVQEWPAEWRGTRMRRVPAGHAGNQDAAKPARAQKEELETILARPPSPAGVHAEFRDAPALREVVKTLSDAEHQSDPSHRLLPPLCGPNPEPPDPFDKHRNEKATTRRAAEATTRVKALLDAGWKVYTADEARPEHEARTAACSPPEDNAPDRPWTGRRRPSPSPARSPRPAKQSRRTRSSRTRTPGRQSSRWNDSNEKPRPARPRSSRTTHDPTTRKH
ncbi:hypothetical protein HMPREF0682_0043 [Propionibacterium acidifaciens F0233]|uniref:Homeodomain-like domain protein n=1 Tax=Propionibacterium acidifaciens F0233 TaxID=553198 RepID=U2PN14_9ACTN|nr:hypothetical protein HMPREF0682_0043 [Propionibacterium acidifaciens F0233]